MSKLLRQVALVSESKKVSLEELTMVSAALQRQAARDLDPIWEISATVDAFASLEDVQAGYWPMIVLDDIGLDNASGVHQDEDGQPFALITSSDDNEVWSLTASHELLEMLVDPFGDRLVAGDSPHPEQGRVLFLVEVCDPSEATEFGYSVNGVLVSDFYTPSYFDPVVSGGVRYSYTSAVREPRQVLPGGYLSWKNPETGEWWQETWFSGPQSKFRNLGPLSVANGSIRSQIDRHTAKERAEAMGHDRATASAAGISRALVERTTHAKARALRAQIAEIVSSKGTPPLAAKKGEPRQADRRHRRRAGRVDPIGRVGDS